MEINLKKIIQELQVHSRMVWLNQYTPRLCIVIPQKKSGTKWKTYMKEMKKIKEAKLQIFRAKFEQMKMNEDEDIETYFLWVDEVVNNIKGLRDELKE